MAATTAELSTDQTIQYLALRKRKEIEKDFYYFFSPPATPFYAVFPVFTWDTYLLPPPHPLFRNKDKTETLAI